MKSPRILIVEDNESLREMLRDMLGGRGIEVIAVPNGPEGLVASVSHPVHAVLVDHDLPGMSGVEFCWEIRRRAQETGRDIPVWMMTGAHEADILEDAKAAGACGVFAKPFSVADICTELARVLAARSSAPI